MSGFQNPTGKTRLAVDGLGTVEGLEFAQGVCQFSGIPYGTLSKRWTRSGLQTTWPSGFHDGTKLGPNAPNPTEYNSFPGILPDLPHHPTPIEDELNCLVLNIVSPPNTAGQKLPVLAFIHGGSFLSGGANMSAYDCVNLCSFSVSRGTPAVFVNLNYRVGLGGFLASRAIKADLERDGYEGCGNFGLYDQQIALHWINRYISSFGGDPEQVMIFGESAGGISVCNQIVAKDPPPFQRAIAMSGHLNTIFAWSLEQHEKHYRALLTHLKIDPDASDSLEQLRTRSQDEVAGATLTVAGTVIATGNPCLDGNFYADTPGFDNITTPPSWLKGYMVGDVMHEAMIFDQSFKEETFDSLRARLTIHLGEEDADFVLNLYGIHKDLSDDERFVRLEELVSDIYFKAHNWVAARRSNLPQTFAYHFDQRSAFEDDPFKGLAYHAIDLHYIFLNSMERHTPEGKELAYAMAGHFIDFAYGKDPWTKYADGYSWMRYGPDNKCTVVTESEDEPVRHFSRMQKIIDKGIFQRALEAVDDISTKRYRMGTGYKVPDLSLFMENPC
ncbi:hypothetical protein TMatcc_006584 [Talaromyces marneffei ATCC 18224]|uniref:Carboxylic ester hydrolase n=1 Tax=Talaromyces marneffei (strain ATCC 18224 / CBS 334.59 / QM 7333) TaxID=441960 RepID=B6QA02_TALMQ|nr:carboxylesterase, putative [Talaromyces marneffei ATCC 18224]